MKVAAKTKGGLRITIEFPDPKAHIKGEGAPSPEEQNQHIREHIEEILPAFGTLVAGIANMAVPLACALFKRLNDALGEQAEFAMEILQHLKEAGSDLERDQLAALIAAGLFSEDELELWHALSGEDLRPLD